MSDYEAFNPIVTSSVKHIGLKNRSVDQGHTVSDTGI